MRTHYTPLAPCPHGERTDRTTSDGRPLCPLCRHAQHTPTIDPDTPDWAALAAGDDTLDDDELRADVDAVPDTPALLLSGLLGQENRIEAMLQRWTDREPEGMLF